VEKIGNNKGSRKDRLSVGRETPGEDVNGRDYRTKKPLECLAGYIRISKEFPVSALAQ
jgi:hypothetical protein